MSSKKPVDVNKARLLALKKIGILKDIPARGELSDKQKRKVREEFKKFHSVANASPGEFKAQDISKLSDSDKKKLRASGYITTDKKIFLPTQGYDSASVKQVWKRNPATGYQEKTLQITRKKGDRKTEIEFIGKPIEKLEWRDRLVREYQSGNFKEGDFVGVKLFDNGRFERETVLSLDVLFRYLENVRWHDRDKQKMHDNLHLVKLSVRDFRDLGDDDDNKANERAKYQRKKNRKATHTLAITNPEKLREIKSKKEKNKGTPTRITGRRKK